MATCGPADLLTLLLAAQDADSGAGLTDTEVRDELSTIMFAGAETTAAALAWTFHELAGHPEVEKQVAEEIRSVVGNRDVMIADVPRLPSEVASVVSHADRIPMIVQPRD